MGFMVGQKMEKMGQDGVWWQLPIDERDWALNATRFDRVMPCDRLSHGNPGRCWLHQQKCPVSRDCATSKSNHFWALVVPLAGLIAAHSPRMCVSVGPVGVPVYDVVTLLAPLPWPYAPKCDVISLSSSILVLHACRPITSCVILLGKTQSHTV